MLHSSTFTADHAMGITTCENKETSFILVGKTVRINQLISKVTPMGKYIFLMCEKTLHTQQT
jgi:hypothetical protein